MAPSHSESPRLTHRTLNGLLWVFMGKGAQSVLHLLLLLILARLLTPRDFGLVSAALVVVGFSSIFSQLGVGPAIVQRAELTIRHIRTGFTLSTLFGASMTVFVWLLAPAIAGFFRIDDLQPVVQVMSFAFLLQGVSTVAESLLRRELRFRNLTAVDAAALTLGLGAVGITMACLGFGAWALVGGRLAEILLRTILLLSIENHSKRPLLEGHALKDFMYFGGGFTLARIGNYFAGKGDQLVVGRWLGAEALGIYGQAQRFLVAPAMALGQSLDTVLFPAMVKVQGDPQRLRAAYRRGVALVALIMLPSGVSCCLLASELIDVLLGPKWSEVAGPFQILALAMLFRTSQKISDSVARATAAVYQRAWRQWLYALLVIGGSWWGRSWGVEGVAVCMLGALAINFILMAQLSLRVTGLTWGAFGAAHLPAVALTAILCTELCAVGSLMRHWNLSPTHLLAVCVAVLLLSAIPLFRYFRSLILGSDGLWMLKTLTAYLPERAHTREWSSSPVHVPVPDPVPVPERNPRTLPSSCNAYKPN